MPARGMAGLWPASAIAVLSLGTLLAFASVDSLRIPAYVYTAAPRFDSDAWVSGAERFPRGASIRVVNGTGFRELAPGFFASADPEVSFDGRRVLFAGKQHAGDAWQIWEVAADAAAASPQTPRRLTNWAEDSVRPLYLPDNKIVYARKAAQGYQLEVLPLAGGQPLRITYAPAAALTCDVLHDGRVLYETANPTHDLYTVYPDGSGVESYRCAHGVNRRAGRQLTSGDLVFATGKGLARFTSALATQVDAVPSRNGEFAGPVAEISSDSWLAAFRPEARSAYGIYSLAPSRGVLAKTAQTPGVQPVSLAPREVPLRFPSGLHDWPGANLLCLNAYTSKTPAAAASIASVRLYSQTADGTSSLLGETPVESDGSFFLHVPTEQPLRLELRDRAGKVIQAEHSFFWMRQGEQRACVGCHAGPERAPENVVPRVLLRADVPVRMEGITK